MKGGEGGASIPPLLVQVEGVGFDKRPDVDKQLSRLSDTFERARAADRPVIATFLTVGFPDRESTLAMVGAMVKGGADIIELGAPFSDPLAEGPTVQRSSQVALDQNITLADCLDCCRNARSRFPDVPLILMGYYNPLLSYGLNRFADDASEAGLDGLIVVDLPLEEAGPLQSAAKARGMDFIFLLAPTSTEERIKRVVAVSLGFVYCVGLTGVTGARREMGADLPEFLGRVRAETDLPLLVGFGISTREHVERAASMSDGVAVGSALINLIEQSEPGDREEKVRNFVRGLRGCAEAL